MGNQPAYFWRKQKWRCRPIAGEKCPLVMEGCFRRMLGLLKKCLTIERRASDGVVTLRCCRRRRRPVQAAALNADFAAAAARRLGGWDGDLHMKGCGVHYEDCFGGT